MKAPPCVNFELLSECCLIMRIDDAINESYLPYLEYSCISARAFFAEALIDLVPSYNSLLVEFNCQLIQPQQALEHFKRYLEENTASRGHNQLNLARSDSNKSIIEIPIYYHPEVGWDLEILSEQLNLPWQKIVEIHQSKRYRVYAMGFLPGFAFMGILHNRLQSHRKTEPRSFVPKGSLAIAERQTAIYPQDSPGGWNIIGRCPIDLFNATLNPVNTLSIYQTVHFKSINRDEYLMLGGQFEEQS